MTQLEMFTTAIREALAAGRGVIVVAPARHSEPPPPRPGLRTITTTGTPTSSWTPVVHEGGKAAA